MNTIKPLVLKTCNAFILKINIIIQKAVKLTNLAVKLRILFSDTKNQAGVISGF